MVSVVGKDTDNGAEGLGFNYRASQIGRSVVNWLPPLRVPSELCCSGAVEMKPRHSLHASA